jgi:hypothetical protein
MLEQEAGKRLTGQDCSQFPMVAEDIERLITSAKDSYSMLGGFLSLPR